jgi:hypothetical protein
MPVKKASELRGSIVILSVISARFFSLAENGPP